MDWRLWNLALRLSVEPRHPLILMRTLILFLAKGSAAAAGTATNGSHDHDDGDIQAPVLCRARTAWCLRETIVL